VIFSEQPPSKQWATLKYRGEKFAEVWFKPEGEPFALTFRIPQRSFQIPGVCQKLTTENLLNAVGIAAEEVESWRHEGAADGTNASDYGLNHALQPPPPEATHLNLHVSLKPPTFAANENGEPPPTVATNESGEPPPTVAANENGEPPPIVATNESGEPPPSTVAANESSEPPAAAPNQSGAPEIPEEKWLYFESRWNAVRALETSMDSLRLNMEGLRAEMEAAARQTLALEVKLHALSADMAQWDKAKSRVRYALPKVREFIHRSTWARATPERKKVEELFESHIRTRIVFPQLDEATAQFEGLLKDRQVLSANGASVYQECKSIMTEIQGTLRTLQSNSVANAKKKGANGPRRKS
jgi:hypothetical protein